MRHLRVAMCLSSDTLLAGGIQEHVLFLSYELRRRGHTVVIFGPKDNAYPYDDYYGVGHIRYAPIVDKTRMRIYANTHAYDRGEAERVSSFLNSGRFDLIHLQGPYKPQVAWHLIRAIRLPKIVTLHDAWNKRSLHNIVRPFFPIFRSIFAPHVQGVIFVSRASARSWQALMAPHVTKAIIPNGVDHRLFAPVQRKRSNRLELLFMARLVERKGLIYLLQALAQLVPLYPNIHLTVVGDGPERNRLEDFVLKSGLSAAVAFRGQLLGKERVQLLQHADIFCAPYEDEAFGITIIEAMACGCPVVGFANSAVKEIFKDSLASKMFVRPRDVRGLIRVLVLLIRDGSLQRKLCVWGLEQSKNYRWEKTAEDTERVYDNIVSRRRRP